MSRLPLRKMSYRRWSTGAAIVAMAGVVVAGASWMSCTQRGGTGAGWQRGRQAYPTSGNPIVIALGNFRGNPMPTERETELSVFLFGVEPEAPLGLSKPRAVAAAGDHLLICDSGAGAVFDADPNAASLRELRLDDRPIHPVALDVAPNGDRLVVDLAARMVRRFDAGGQQVARYTRTDSPFRPADCLCVGNDVWVTNVAAHQIDVFDGASGSPKRTIGTRGAANGQFGMPLGMARTPKGDVCVVDSLNARVQVLDSSGAWVRNIGRPGNRAGCFGRPKDVAVGSDGVVFVVDAASQRVHAFDETGRVLLTFGEPFSGAGALAMPNGIAVSEQWTEDAGAMPGGFSPAYAIYVAEQLDRPGVRVYAWGRNIDLRIAESQQTGDGNRSRSTQVAKVANPHWAANQCNACHAMDAARRPQPIAPAAVNDLCLNCHDGKKAHGEPHPIGRVAETRLVSTPSDWPTVDGRIACLTCHDIQRHCGNAPQRPAANSAMLRHHEPENPIALCMKCHEADDSWRISPHNQIDRGGLLKSDSCLFCHTSAPFTSTGGAVSQTPALRTEPERLCMSCHTKHWDYFPEGHVEHPMPPTMLRELESAGGAKARRLPLNQNRVMCYTCHNPHEPGVFAAGSDAGAFAASTDDAKVLLRMNRADLCVACHPK